MTGIEVIVSEPTTQITEVEVLDTDTIVEVTTETTDVQILVEVSEGGGGSSSGVQSVTGDGVGGSSTNVVLSFPTPAEIGAEPSITSGTTGQYWRGDKSFQTLDKTAVGLGNVDNTSDLNKPISTSTQSALDGKQPKFITATATLTTGSWSLVSGLYEQSVSNVNITATSIVDVIPDNAAFATVTAAQILPRTDSASGSVKVYSNNLPSANIGITLNIWN